MPKLLHLSSEIDLSESSLPEIADRLRHTSINQKENWRRACELELLRVWPEFHKSHPYLVPDPAPGIRTPREGAAYPSLFQTYLAAVTGVGGWRVALDSKKAGHFLVTIPVMP